MVVVVWKSDLGVWNTVLLSRVFMGSGSANEERFLEVVPPWFLVFLDL